MPESNESSFLTEPDTQLDKYLTFHLDEEVYGIEIRYVTEIVGIQKISILPESPDYVKGIINLRGKIIPVVDMRLRLKKRELSYTDRTCIVVVDISQIIVGLIVDAVDEVLTIPEDATVPASEFHYAAQGGYVKSVGKVDNAIRLLLDCEKLFSGDDVCKIEQAIN